MKNTQFRFTAIIAVVVIFAALYGCGSKKDDRPVLTVSIEPQRYILEQIAGDNYRVVTLMDKGGDPEAFEPSINVRRAVDDSKIYFTIGALPFEHTLAISTDVPVIDTSADIEPIYGTHAHHHANFLGEHDDSADMTDPHFWASVRNMRRMGRTMTDALKMADPDNADGFESRFAALDHRLDSLDQDFARRLSHGQRAFIVWHPSLSYFARDYGLQQLSVGATNKEVSISNLREVINEAKKHNVKVFLNQGFCKDEQARTIVDAVGAHMVNFDILGYDWEDQLKHIVDELARL